MAIYYPGGEQAHRLVTPASKLKGFSELELGNLMAQAHIQEIPIREQPGQPVSRWILCDEDGRMKGLPLNHQATADYGRFVRGRTLRGPVLIVERGELK